MVLIYTCKEVYMEDKYIYALGGSEEHACGVDYFQMYSTVKLIQTSGESALCSNKVSKDELHVDAGDCGGFSSSVPSRKPSRKRCREDVSCR